jgi:hypothetical protein
MSSLLSLASPSAPSSQKAADRPISFTLQDTSKGSDPLLVVPLYIRPEELTVNKPSRMMAHQTFGGTGGWVDSFGQGIPTLNISGTTGWRPDENGDDSLMRLLRLHSVVFARWHALRAAKTLAGLDPDAIKLIFSDSMDSISWVVAPQSFVLKRDKRRPLLSQFQISLTYIDQYVAGSSSSGSSLLGSLSALGLDSIVASLNTAADFLSNIAGGVASALGTAVSAVKSFVKTVTTVAGAVMKVIKAGLSIVNTITYGLVTMARDLTRAASSVFAVFSAIASIPSYVKAQFMKVRSAFTNMFCVFSNCFKQSKLLQDFSGVYGSSCCSSTSGGTPLSAYLNSNTFAQIQAAGGTTQLQTTTECANSISTLKNIDPVTNPPGTQMIMGHLVNVNNGLVVTS